MNESLSSLDKLVRLWWVLALATLLGAAGGAIASIAMPVTYTANAYVLVAAVDSDDNVTAVNLTQAYGRIMEQPEILGSVAAVVGSTTEQLQRDVQASTSPDAPLVVLTASAGSAERAADVANAAADSLVVFGNNQSVTTGVRLTMFSGASSPPSPASPVLSLNIALGAAAGLLIGGLGVVARPAMGPGRPEGSDHTREAALVPGTHGGRDAGSERADHEHLLVHEVGQSTNGSGTVQENGLPVRGSSS